MATAFCIYSETDNSLNFYKRDTIPSVGDTFNGDGTIELVEKEETPEPAMMMMSRRSVAVTQEKVRDIIDVDNG